MLIPEGILVKEHNSLRIAMDPLAEKTQTARAQGQRLCMNNGKENKTSISKNEKAINSAQSIFFSCLTFSGYSLSHLFLASSITSLFSSRVLFSDHRHRATRRVEPVRIFFLPFLSDRVIAILSGSFCSQLRSRVLILQTREMVECSVCNSKLVSKAYTSLTSKQRALKILLVSGDCILVGLQPILVYMSKVNGKFDFSPVSVNFLTEITKVLFAIIMLLFQARNQKAGEKPFMTTSTFIQAAKNNVLLAVPALLYAINNYLKFIMQLYFNPATVKMLSNVKVFVIAILLKIIMKRRFSVIQWEALTLLLIGITVNQLKSIPEGSTALGLPVATGAYLYTLIFVTVPALASVFNEYALKSQFETSIYLQNLFLYGYGAIFNFLAISGTAMVKGPESFDIFKGHSKATMFLVCNNAAQGILSSFFFKYADTILKKYSSTLATIFTGIASAALFGHALTINFVLGITIVFISMHQYFSGQVKEEKSHSKTEMTEYQDLRTKEASVINATSSAMDEVSRRAGHEHEEKQPLLPV